MGSEPTSSLDRTRQSYDEVPYDTAPMIRSHPGRLAAQALWRGLPAPDAARARVLEIGCATGGNLLPLAAQLPGARFLGVDLSAVQIAAGEARRKLYGLANVELRADSFEALGPADGEFDYIICHGVYAWIPEGLRDPLMRVIRERLAPEGVAMVSFNVLPGWRVHQVIRDAMLLHAGAVADPNQRAEQARELFGLMAEQSDELFSYGKIWRHEAVRLIAGGDSYIAHEIFEENNVPETFAGFTARAARFDLDYLGESTVAAGSLSDLPPAGGESVLRFSGGDRLKRETYIDIFSGRTFRESLLMRGGRAQAISAEPQGLEALHFIPALDLEFGASAESPNAFAFTLKQAKLPVEAALEPAIHRFMARQPASSQLADFEPFADPAARPALRRLLIAAIDLGMIAISSLPILCASQIPERAKLWPLAALDAVDSPITTTLRHAPFQFAQLQRLVGPLLDGTRRREQIVAELVEMAERGVFRIGGPEGPVTDRETMQARLDGATTRALAGFLRAGLLVDG